MIELQDPRNIELSGTTLELLARVTQSNEELLKFRPFSEAVGERLRRALLPDRVTATLNMEGIIATRRQTLSVMDAMRVSESVGRAEQEIFNTLKADEFAHDLVERGLPLNEQVVREINRLLLSGIRSDAGQYRAGQVELPGAPFEPPLASDVPELTHRLCELYPLGDVQGHPVLRS